ncbi:MAG: type II secretion system F family protein [Sandaracinobacteroides sp.]
MAALQGLGSFQPFGWRERKRRLERLSALRPVSNRRRDVQRARTARPVAAAIAGVIDPLLGIDRLKASDEPMSVWMPILTGLGAAVAAHAVLTRLLGVAELYALPVALAAALMVARGAIAGKRDKVCELMEEQFALALGVIIRCVRAGLPVNEGMRAVAAEVAIPTGPEFRRAVDQIQLGQGFDAALQSLADRCAISDYRFFAVSVSLQRQTGGNLAETLDNLSDTIRKRRAVKLKARALTSETRATVLVLALLPVVVAGVLMVVNPPYVLQLFTTPDGRRLLGIAILVQMVGLAVIRFISRKSLS